MGLEDRFRKLEQPFKALDGPPPISLIEVRCSGFDELPADEQRRIRAEAVAEQSAYPGMPRIVTLRPPEKEVSGE